LLKAKEELNEKMQKAVDDFPSNIEDLDKATIPFKNFLNLD
jgi:hypothetical protein